jgi:hypothetical protein
MALLLVIASISSSCSTEVKSTGSAELVKPTATSAVAPEPPRAYLGPLEDLAPRRSKEALVDTSDLIVIANVTSFAGDGFHYSFL